MATMIRKIVGWLMIAGVIGLAIALISFHLFGGGVSTYLIIRYIIVLPICLIIGIKTLRGVKNG